MKQEYLTPSIRIVVVYEQDVITASTPLSFMTGAQSEENGTGQYFEDIFG
ncbi:MAG: hypothetical protein J6U92_00315 [Clostridia bacterium]|nr:hypothetical protein [Clostridia bacterium]